MHPQINRGAKMVGQIVEELWIKLSVAIKKRGRGSF